MKKLLILIAGCAFAAGVSAQQYKWIERDGKVRYGDVPPPGVKATPLKAPASPPPAPAAKPADKGDKANKSAGPLSPAEQEAEYRKRQQEAQKTREKQQQAEKDDQAKRNNCSQAQEQLRYLESGQRIARVDAKGERYFLEDDQIAREVSKARQAVQQWCS